MASIQDRINELVASKEKYNEEGMEQEETLEVHDIPNSHSLRTRFYGIPFPAKAEKIITDRGQISGWQLSGPKGEYVIPKRREKGYVFLLIPTLTDEFYQVSMMPMAPSITTGKKVDATSARSIPRI